MHNKCQQGTAFAEVRKRTMLLQSALFYTF
jgi:hypothetical protein